MPNAVFVREGERVVIDPRKGYLFHETPDGMSLTPLSRFRRLTPASLAYAYRAWGFVELTTTERGYRKRDDCRVKGCTEPRYERRAGVRAPLCEAHFRQERSALNKARRAFKQLGGAA